MIDIGGGTTGMAVFEEADLLHTAILPIGSSHITNDIAIGLRIPIDVAEQIKIEYGSALSSEISKTDKIEFAKVGEAEGEFSRREVAGMIEARLYEIFDLVNKELNKIGKAGLLPAGVVITGAGAKLPFIVDLAKKVLKLPCQIGFPQRLEFDGLADRIEDPSFASAAGLILWGKDELEGAEGTRFSLPGTGFGTKIKKIFKIFLP
jgi:cell division protein FtsA